MGTEGEATVVIKIQESFFSLLLEFKINEKHYCKKSFCLVGFGDLSDRIRSKLTLLSLDSARKILETCY